jgi:hypothetical protein
VDSAGQALDGSQTYKLPLPPHIPAKNFRSFLLYDNLTRSMLQTDQQFPSIGSQKQGLVINPDTSVDVWFGPTAPAGHEANWVQFVPGKGWNTLLRLYGPPQPWFDKTWKPGEFELVKQARAAKPIKKLLREPLLRFLLLGAAIFAAYSLVSKRGGGGEPGKIVVTQGQVAAMAEGHVSRDEPR